MNLPRYLGVLAAVMLLFVGCSTVDSRIAQNRAAFSSWPPAVQDKVVLGQIDLGFTPEQVRVALGDPDYESVRTTADGSSVVWGFRDRKPRFSFGIGVGMGRGSTGVGAGAGVGPDGFRDNEKVRVAFDPSGRVSSIEVAQRR
ncbi:MAG: hypothetical protein RIQ93_2909 [Verrucomicrobiota bacterium]|jgi:hypothetical protein